MGNIYFMKYILIYIAGITKLCIKKHIGILRININYRHIHFIDIINTNVLVYINVYINNKIYY